MVPTLLLAFALQSDVKPACCEKGIGKPWRGYDQGVAWQQDGKAWETAKTEKKLVLVFELDGDLDKLGCVAGAHAMRSVTFADESVLLALKDGFVCTWNNRQPKFHTCNTARDEFLINEAADAWPTGGFTTYLCAPDRTVLHYFTGFFSPRLFLEEIRFAQRLYRGAFDENGALRPDTVKEMHGFNINNRRNQRRYSLASRGDDAEWKLSGGDAGYAHLEQVNEEFRKRGPRKLDDIVKDHLRGRPKALPGVGAAPADPAPDVKLAPAKNACCKGGVAEAWPAYNKGIVWRQDDKAWADAKTAKKLVMVFELVGDLDKEGC